MAQLRIGDRQYEAVDPRGGARLLHLIELAEHTKRLLGAPIGMHRLDEMSRNARALASRVRAAESAHRAAVDAGADPVVVAELAEDVRTAKGAQADDGLLGLAILVFLSRRAAGDRCTFAQACDVPVDQVEWIPDPSDALPVPPDGDEPDEDPFGPGESPDPPTADGGPETPVSAPVRRPRREKPAKTSR